MATACAGQLTSPCGLALHIPCTCTCTCMQGSGAQIQADFAVPNLVQFPITEDLSAAGDGGQPLVVTDPAGPVAAAFGDLGAAVVREIAKLSRAAKNSVRFDEELRAFVVRLPSQNGAASGAQPSPPSSTAGLCF